MKIFRKILCFIDFHWWEHSTHVVTLKKHDHVRGLEEIDAWHKPMTETYGRECKWCGKEQYSVLNWTYLRFYDAYSEIAEEDKEIYDRVYGNKVAS